MTFYERYAKIAEQHDLDPCSQKAADLFGLTKATISSWNVKATTPKGETVAVMADKLGVSTDYLLGRTDDPTDYAHQVFMNPPVVETNDDAPADKQTNVKAFPVRKQTPSSIPGVSQAFLLLYSRLDDADKLKAEGVIQGMLMQDKYTSAALPNAAHVRTDTKVTAEMIEHDEDIMDDENF